MAKISIETLTCLHIGSGETLQYGLDFFEGKYGGDTVVAVTDLRKLTELVGVENVTRLTAAFERKQNVPDIVKTLCPRVKIEDYTKRLLYKWYDNTPGNELKEFIHDGMGRAYIPGSSIKGALRTCVTAAIAGKKGKSLQYSILNDFGKPQTSRVEGSFFGADPNSDIFRFLRVGDAIFFEDSELIEAVVRMVNVNEREKQSFWDTSKPMLVNVLADGLTSSFEMKIDSVQYRFTKERWPKGTDLKKINPLPDMPDEMKSVGSLFSLVNSHTIHLLETEIKYWKEREAICDGDTVTEYISKVKEILKLAKECKDGYECVLRIGHGSGWRFITGAWTEGYDNFKSAIVPVARPNNKSHSQYDFPKSRRVDDAMSLLGFVKLSKG